MAIDDPQDQLESQYPDEPESALTPIAKIGASVLGLFPVTAIAGALATAIAETWDFFTRERAAERLNVLYKGIRDELRDVKLRVDQIDAEIRSPLAQETILTAVQQTLRATRMDKVLSFGRIIGATLKADAPDWERASEFVRDLEQLNTQDIAAMHLLWSVQHAQEAEPGRMHTDANRYTGEWHRVKGLAAGNLRWHTDELYSRCARLMGFGLALEVQPNDGFQGPDDHCFRLTGKGVQLLRMLGATPEMLPPFEYHVDIFGRKP